MRPLSRKQLEAIHLIGVAFLVILFVGICGSSNLSVVEMVVILAVEVAVSVFGWLLVKSR